MVNNAIFFPGVAEAILGFQGGNPSLQKRKAPILRTDADALAWIPPSAIPTPRLGGKARHAHEAIPTCASRFWKPRRRTGGALDLFPYRSSGEQLWPCPAGLKTRSYTYASAPFARQTRQFWSREPSWG